MEKTAVYDADLQVEAYFFQGYLQPFPVHFHPYYVLGLIEEGTRRLVCKKEEYFLKPGDVLAFNPGDSHTCTQSSGALCYRSVNLPMEALLNLSERTGGKRGPLPVFPETVVQDTEAAEQLRSLHRLIFQRAGAAEKDDALLALLSGLLKTRAAVPVDCRGEVNAVCAYLACHVTEHIQMEELGRQVGLSSSALLRAFTRAKGVTPYRYLEALRVSEAKKLLESGVTPAEAALRAGFFDQSHFTRYFTRFIGLSPGAYRNIFVPSVNETEEEEESYGTSKG